MPEWVTIGSPVGPLTLVAAGGSLTGLYLEAHRHGPGLAALGSAGDPAAAPFTAAASQLAAYFAGRLTRFDLPLQSAGTAFQQRVWRALRAIGYGQTVSYGELAAGIGAPRAGRAVGLANGRNPISIVVPCHRVIACDGSLTGYGGGLERKRFLLELERRAAAGTARPDCAASPDDQPSFMTPEAPARRYGDIGQSCPDPAGHQPR